MRDDVSDTAPDSSEQEQERTTTSLSSLSPAERRKRHNAFKRRGRVMSADLPEALETLTRRSLVKLDKIIKLPLDGKNAQLVRSIVTACGIAISSQLRADEARLKQKATGDALQRLLKIIESERKLLQSPPLEDK